MKHTNEEKVLTDVVVLGTGAAGLCAALTLALGGSRVSVLEKMPGYGGMTGYAIGMFAVESKYISGTGSKGCLIQNRGAICGLESRVWTKTEESYKPGPASA